MARKTFDVATPRKAGPPGAPRQPAFRPPKEPATKATAPQPPIPAKKVKTTKPTFQKPGTPKPIMKGMGGAR